MPLNSRSSSPRNNYTNVDELIESTPLSVVLQHYGLPQPETQSKEYRLKCVFDESCSESQYGNLTISNDAAKRIYCHSCQTRGNLLTLLHGFDVGKPPAGGKLRGREFKDAVEKLQAIVDRSGSIPESAPAVDQKPVASPVSDQPTKNVPLKSHPKEAARAIADLYNDLVTDVSEMSPDAAQYVRKRAWMTPELMKKWGVGWIVGSGRSLFRNKYIVYTHRSERGDIVSYSGRNLSFEEKWAQWIKAGRPDGKKPVKHRYVSGFHRGAELYGGHATRLVEPYIQSSLQQHGLVIVEGQNDVHRMGALEVAAVGLCSNRATNQQVDTITRYARTAANNRVLLLPDCDEEGEAGFKDLLWKLNEQQIQTRLGISSSMNNGIFNNRQPEDLTEEEWALIVSGG
ncbi:MAG: DNA primase [Fuerstiella sp.]